MDKARREAQYMNTVVAALQELGGSATLDALVPLIDIPPSAAEVYRTLPTHYADGRDRLREDLRHVADYLSQEGCLTRDAGQWSLTEEGRKLRPPFSDRDVQRIMAPGDEHWDPNRRPTSR